MFKKKENPCKGLEVERNPSGLSDVFVGLLADAVDSDKESARKLFNV